MLNHIVAIPCQRPVSLQISRARCEGLCVPSRTSHAASREFPSGRPPSRTCHMRNHIKAAPRHRPISLQIFTARCKGSTRAVAYVTSRSLKLTLEEPPIRCRTRYTQNQIKATPRQCPVSQNISPTIRAHLYTPLQAAHRFASAGKKNHSHGNPPKGPTQILHEGSIKTPSHVPNGPCKYTRLASTSC